MFRGFSFRMLMTGKNVLENAFLRNRKTNARSLFLFEQNDLLVRDSNEPVRFIHVAYSTVEDDLEDTVLESCERRAAHTGRCP